VYAANQSKGRQFFHLTYEFLIPDIIRDGQRRVRDVVQCTDDPDTDVTRDL
jgi:hypothetical protein